MVLLGVKDMSESDEEDRGTLFDWRESQSEKKKPSSTKRTHRSMYGDDGQYIGEQRIFFPLFCLIVGIPMIGLGIFAVISMPGDDRIVLSGIGFCLGGFCNFLGVYALLIYFNVIDGPSKRGTSIPLTTYPNNDRVDKIDQNDWIDDAWE